MEVFLTRGDDESRHIQGSRGNHHLCIALSEVSFRTMLLSRDDHADILVFLAPSDDVHHRFRLVATHRHRLIEAVEESLVALLTLGDDDESRYDEISHHGNLFLIVEADDVGEVTREALPVGLQRQNATCTSLEVKMVGSRGSAFRTIVEYRQFTVQG